MQLKASAAEYQQLKASAAVEYSAQEQGAGM